MTSCAFSGEGITIFNQDVGVVSVLFDMATEVMESTKTVISATSLSAAGKAAPAMASSGGKTAAKCSAPTLAVAPSTPASITCRNGTALRAPSLLSGMAEIIKIPVHEADQGIGL